MSKSKPDRQDGDGADELFESAVLAAMHTTLSSAVIDAMTAMVRDTDASVAIQRATLPTILFAKEILATCASPPTRDGAEGAGIGERIDRLTATLIGTDRPHDPAALHSLRKLLFIVRDIERRTCAPPKPQPDAMWSLIKAYRHHGGRLFGGFTVADDIEAVLMGDRTVGLSAPHRLAAGARRHLTDNEDRLMRSALIGSGITIEDLPSPAVAAEPGPNWDKIAEEYMPSTAILSLPVQPAIDKTKLYTALNKFIPQDMIDSIWQEIQEATL